MAHKVRKFFVMLSGSYIILIGLIILIALGVTLYFGVETKTNEIFKGQTTLISLVMAAWFISTGTGIILRKNWARYSLFAMSGLALVNGLLMCLIMPFVPLSGATIRDRLSMSLIFLILLVLIPVFFLIFFNRKAVKDMYS